LKKISFTKEINLFKPACHYYPGIDYLIPDETYRDFLSDHTKNGFEYVATVQDFGTESNWQYGQDANELLVYITGALGDSLWHTALVRAIKKRLPHVAIDVVIDPRHHLIWLNNKDVRTVKIAPFVCDSLTHYDGHIILDEAVASRKDVSQSNCYEILFDAVGIPFSPQESFPHLRLTEDDEVRAYSTLAGLHNQRAYESHWYMLLGLHSSSHTRNLSAQQWFEIVQAFSEKYANLPGFKIYGFSMDADIAEEYHPLLQQSPFYEPLHAQMDILSVAALMRRAMGLVSVDTMYTHMAAAVNCPTVALMSTVPGYYRVSTYPFAESIDNHASCSFAPCFWKRDQFRYQKADHIEIAPCYTAQRRQCEVMKAVKPEQVIAAWNRVTAKREAFDGYQVADLK
jgi:ADP-heptose:LPS heptosyltransferase